MAAKESTKSTKSSEDGAAPQAGFYGLADHPNHGIISSILKRKNRKFKMADDVRKMCKQVEAYKTSADRLHQALMTMLVEFPEYARDLVFVVKTDPNYRYAALYLRTFESILNKGRDRTTYESLEPVMKTLQSLDLEHERRVRKQLDNLKPLMKFIGEDYWEYARLRKVYWEAMESYDDALTQQHKERTDLAEQATANAQTWKNDCRQKLMDFIKTCIFDRQGKHAECVLKFRDEAVFYHRSMSELIPFTEKPEKGESKSAERGKTPK
ncbi:hypothetical protein GCK72_019743 [Caenorhabditis remanei]|uniref:BAR domain-containing protein n=1 Tax=Caenorhabditis remanei TaxID=31234 RepID=A0A6A5GD67_CAERE|nr:hypothetical protein GCK72_019743 [Caenorhabditis remanei]KAF1753187.1 hypothetical protein GCK72_019743 [Caenorhabditis remanei]